MNTLPRKKVDFSSTVDRIHQILNGLQQGSSGLVLIGGCSRSGKSTLAEELKSSLVSRGVYSIVIPADYWLVPASKRQAGATVLQRYRLDELSDSVMSLLKGESVCVTPYNSYTRELSLKLLTLRCIPSPSIVLVEGVIILALGKLRKLSALKLFVDCEDCTRVRRLIRFYRDFKLLRKSEYKAIIKEREIEEVPFIKATRAFADLVIGPY